MTGMEPLVAVAASAVSGVAVPICQSLWGFLGTLVRGGRGLIFTASKQYVQNYAERHGILKVLGMREPVKLESVYTAVQFLDNEARSGFDSIENLERIYRQANRRKFQSQDQGKQEGIKVANDKQYLMVLGGPGAGKSTFLRKMGLEALKGQRGEFKHGCIPVFIELKRFTSSDINITNFIAEEFRICGFPEPTQFTAKALEQGKLLILLDGLDEVPTTNSNNVIIHIQNFVDTYDKNRFITSCRVAAYRHKFRRFTDVVMADFDDIQIENFINNWFSSKPLIGKDCWKKLRSDEYTAAKELTQTPLLLTLVCLLYQRSGTIPTNRATLYERALRVLLEEWAAEAGIIREDLYKGLDTKRKEMILSEIAHDAFQEDHLFFDKREIAKKIESLLAEILPDEQFIDGLNVLKSIEVQHGVLVERADMIYSFSHLTLQEYLTAQYIDDHRKIEKLVNEHLTDERWKEVFLLVAGLMRGSADDLLLLMEKKAQDIINTPRLQALLNWAEQATTGSAGDLNPVGKRAVAIAKAIAIAEANAIATARDYAEAGNYAEAHIYTEAYAETYRIAKTYANAIAEATNYTEITDERQPLLNASNLSPDIINLSQEKAKALKNYLYTSHLIIQCKQASVRVSPTTWEAIEARMLLVPSN